MSAVSCMHQMTNFNSISIASLSSHRCSGMMYATVCVSLCGTWHAASSACGKPYMIYCAPVYSTTMNIRCVCVHKKVLEHSGPFSPGVHYLVPHMHNDSMVSNLNNLHRPICCYESAVLCMSCSNDSLIQVTLIQVNCAG